MRNLKRSIAVLLCLAVLCAFAPMAAFAAETNAGKILNDAYALAKDTALNYDATLTGKITKINTPYDAGYGNISVTIEVAGYADKPMLCYRLKGTGADQLALGDTITVTGKIKNYMGTIEFDAGCTLDKLVKGDNDAVVAPTDPKKIVDAAFALEKGGSLPYNCTLVGKITKIVSPYDSGYKNITVNIEVAGSNGNKTIECYRMKGEGAEALAVGDYIAVTGQLTRYYKAATEDKAEVDKIEFNSGCTFVKSSAPVDAPTDPKKIVDAAFALEKGASLPYTATLTGKITKIVEEYSEQYGNITVNIEVEGSNGKKTIECYRMKGEGANTLKVGDYIAVTGTVTRYFKEATEDKAELDKIEFTTGCTFVRTAPPSSGNSGNTDGGNTQKPDSGNTQKPDSGNTQKPSTNLPSDGSDTVNTLFVKVPADWSTVNAYAWSDSNNKILGDWPGTALSTKDGDWYKIALPEATTGVVINTGSVQSADLAIESGKDVYVTVAADKNAEGKHLITAQYADGTTSGGNDDVISDGAADENITGTESNFRVVGNADWMGNWDPASDAGKMLEVAPGVYKKNFENVQPGDYELKITQNGTWDNSWGDNGNNFAFTIVEACTITVTFTLDGTTGTISVKGEGVSAVTGDVSMFSIVTLLTLATCAAGILLLNKKKFF